ncbi:MAG TPA: glycosyltransferase [Ignavibacteria bacterium]|nr:glycosyltransferase [Ignavibacteria bacterium]HRJ98008.1 glycosyltransferase [Ignavibacteria bacterium]
MRKVSIIISVYNKTRELELIFYALSIQSFKDFEVIIAEDGRDAGMEKFIENLKREFNFPVIHLTQDDIGFRKNKILNDAIRKSSSEYLIFFDGDCIPHSDFIKSHFENKVENTVLCGRRVNLTKKISESLTKESILNRDYEKIRIADAIFSTLNRDKRDFNFNIEEGIMIKNPSLRKVLTNEDEHILGCNFSIPKNLLLRINGFDENYEGPGLGEDSDIEFRLRLINAKFKSVRNLAVQYHMYHPKTIENEMNMKYFNQVKERKEFYCRNGLEKVN